MESKQALVNCDEKLNKLIQKTVTALSLQPSTINELQDLIAVLIKRAQQIPYNDSISHIIANLNTFNNACKSIAQPPTKPLCSPTGRFKTEQEFKKIKNELLTNMPTILVSLAVFEAFNFSNKTNTSN
jgi:hypothetical protein